MRPSKPTPKRLSNDAVLLLRESVSKHRPDLFPVLEQLGTVKLTKEQRNGLQEALGVEFNLTGLQEDDEPNQRGLDLEEIIDILAEWNENY